MSLLRGTVRRLRDRLSPDHGPELSADDQLFAERLSEMLRAYAEEEIPDSTVPDFRVPGQTGRRVLTRRTSRPARTRSVRRPLPTPMEVSHEDPH